MIGSHDDLLNHMQTNFNLMYLHRYSLFELEDMMPWERDVYIAMLAKQKEKESKK